MNSHLAQEDDFLKFLQHNKYVNIRNIVNNDIFVNHLCPSLYDQ